MAANNGTPPQRGWGILRLLLGLGTAVLLAMCYMDFVFLPQKKALDDAQATVTGLGRELANLRSGASKQDKEHWADQDVLHERVTFLESMLRDLDPRLGEKIDAHVELMKSGGQRAAEVQDAVVMAEAERLKQAKAVVGEKIKGTKTETEKGKMDNKQKKQTITAPWRADDKCGLLVPGSVGTLVGCNPAGEFPCCSRAGWCGVTEQHCTCERCIDFRRDTASQVDMKSDPSDPPYDESKPKSIALVVPFRDRAAHLEKFREKIEALVEAWSSKNVKHTWMLFVVEQFDNELFNRGWLFNVGFKHATDYAKDKGITFDCVVMHDVDILPTPVVDYGWCQWPNQLSGEIECWGNSVPYMTSTGGVISLSPTHWNRINGFSNEYQGWGGEDDDLYERLRQNTLLRGSCHVFCETARRTPMVVRPPLGKGRFTCTNDGDHTPRLRNSNDQAMWSRLNAMKANSRRWQEDGITSVSSHHAGPPLESAACETQCEAPEDPTPRKRLYGEHWSRVSMKPLPRISRIKVILPSKLKCADESRPLKTIPLGVAHLRRILPELFGPKCELDEQWIEQQNFVLIDATLGQSVLVGSGAPVIQADLALPLISEKAKASATKNPKARDPEYVVQGQRLGRWIRRLPADHTGYITVTQEPLAAVYANQVKKGNRHAQTVPACIASASFGQSGKKYRVTPGSIWCGDGGWSSSAHFTVLRSNSSVPKEKLFPICIGYCSAHHTYRFENSVSGCVGRHEDSGTVWTHAGTMHTSTDATGDDVCVGQINEGQRTRWMMRKAKNCAEDGYYHKFSFKAMAPKYSPALVPLCLFTAEPIEGSNSLMRLSVSDRKEETCSARRPEDERGFNTWAVVKERSLLAKRQAKTDMRLCVATASVDLTAAGAITEAGVVEEGLVKGWRLLRDKDCESNQYSAIEKTKEGEISVTWNVLSLPKVFVPSRASGPTLCVCRVSDGSPAKELLQRSLREASCDAPRSEEEFCFNTLSGEDLIQASYVLDEPA